MRNRAGLWECRPAPDPLDAICRSPWPLSDVSLPRTVADYGRRRENRNSTQTHAPRMYSRDRRLNSRDRARRPIDVGRGERADSGELPDSGRSRKTPPISPDSTSLFTCQIGLASYSQNRDNRPRRSTIGAVSSLSQITPSHGASPARIPGDLPGPRLGGEQKFFISASGIPTLEVYTRAGAT